VKTRRTIARAGLLLGAVLVAVAPVRAADRWQFVPGLTVAGEYNDNVTLAPDGSPDREGDVAASAVAELGLRYHTYFTEGIARVTPTFRYFFGHPGNNTDSLLDSLGIDVEYRRWLSQRVRLEATDHLIYFLDVQAQGPSAAVLPRQESLVNALDLSLSHQVAMRTKMVYDARVESQEFKDPAVFDSIQYAPTVSIEQTVGEAVTLRAFGSWRRALFSADTDLIRGVYDRGVKRSAVPFDLASSGDYDLYVVGVGVVYRITPTLSMTANSGVLVPVHDTGPAYETAHLDWLQGFALEKTFNRMQLAVRYNRDIAPTQGLNDQVLNQTVGVDFSREWLRDLRTVLFADYGRFEANAGDIDQLRGGATLHYLVLPWMGIGAGYEYTWQSSKFGDTHQRTTGSRATVSVSFLPPRPDALRF
jgi:hypothetical protein